MTTPEQPGQGPQDWQTPSNPYGPPSGSGPYGQQQYGPYGPPPGGDPNQQYGQYGQYGQYAPQGPAPYQQQQYGYYPPGGYPPRQEGPRTHAIVALVVSIVLALSCYVTPGGIAGAIMSGIALSKVDTNPDQARNLLKWTWISIGINVALLVVGVGAVVWAGVNGYLD
ncbi:hypothetical protein GCM10010116_41920 [Microbispora rosea subsp. aerata]|nr:MgtC/SapB family protein [Microbispora rosea]GGO20855.1 hypothetical protein GCM10010116_41920 [Microbispora rosea subsp. aerata]GIH56089.1 hypothetical protein Mro02_30030 [Microbispora rosea subsp. aerata]GLJ85654.1 hypothetical protein GCM10017588_43870 [Microbispora rosea subsp. aerata]